MQTDYVNTLSHSEHMSLLRSIFGQRQDFGAVFRHQYGVFPLRRQFAIHSANCPSVTSIENGFPGSRVQHRLDRETGSGFDVRATRFAGIMRNTWFLMKLASDSVSLAGQRGKVARTYAAATIYATVAIYAI